MSITSKLASAFKGTVREAAEGVVDANSIRILGQEIHEFENDITESKQKLALIISQAIQVERQISQTESSIEENEKEAVKLLEEDNEAGAIEVAEGIAELESKAKQLKKHQTNLRSHEQTLKSSLKVMISNLDTYKSEYNMAKANENMHKAQSKLAQTDKNANNRFADIQNSLERIQSRQQESSDQMEAMAQVEDSFSTETPNKFRETNKSATEILERIKSKSV